MSKTFHYVLLQIKVTNNKNKFNNLVIIDEALDIVEEKDFTYLVKSKIVKKKY